MSKAYERLEKCLACVRQVTDFTPEVGLVLGSGLGGFAECIEVEATLDYSQIEGFPVSTVAGHAGRFIFGKVHGVSVVCMQGRVHYYEGYGMEDVVLPIRLMKMMGAKTLLLTNAAGGINETFNAGDFMMITDQISSFVPSPLVGPNIDELGVRFPDMSHIYDKELQRAMREAAEAHNISLREGVYVQASGPNYESPAEIRMFSGAGADAVGMSTAVEAIAAVHAGMRVGGISLISNPAAGISKVPLSHKEVQEAADMAAVRFQELISSVIQGIGGMN